MKFSRNIEWCFEGVLRVLQENFKVVSMMFQGCFMKVSRKKNFKEFQGCFMIFKGVSRVFQRCFKEVSRKLSRFLKKSFMLYGTHRSFPSRKRACFHNFMMLLVHFI